MDIGTKIKIKRVEKGLKQKQLAERAHMTPRAISEIERGKRQIRRHEMLNIAQALSISPSFFLEKEDDASSDNFSGIGTDIRSTTTEIDRVDVLLREVSKMTPEQRQEFWDGILKIVEVVVQTRFKQGKPKDKDKTVLVLE